MSKFRACHCLLKSKYPGAIACHEILDRIGCHLRGCIRVQSWLFRQSNWCRECERSTFGHQNRLPHRMVCGVCGLRVLRIGRLHQLEISFPSRRSTHLDQAAKAEDRKKQVRQLNPHTAQLECAVVFPVENLRRERLTCRLVEGHERVQQLLFLDKRWSHTHARPNASRDTGPRHR